MKNVSRETGIKKLIGKVRVAIEKYNMINEGMKIAVGVSGGKDSLTLLKALSIIQKYYPKKFSLIAISIDMGFPVTTDWYDVEFFCKENNIEYIVKKTEIYKIVFDIRHEKCPCSLCANMRRGVLHNTALEYGCHCIALGHHIDDYVETFFMNLLNNGEIRSFFPVTYLTRKKLWMIRPLIFCKESEISNFAQRFCLPTIKSNCPADGVTERQRVKDLIRDLEKQYPALKQKVVGALQKMNLNLKERNDSEDEL